MSLARVVDDEVGGCEDEVGLLYSSEVEIAQDDVERRLADVGARGTIQPEIVEQWFQERERVLLGRREVLHEPAAVVRPHLTPVARHRPQWLDPSSSLDDWYTQLQCTDDVSLSSIITSQRDLSRICC